MISIINGQVTVRAFQCASLAAYASQLMVPKAVRSLRTDTKSCSLFLQLKVLILTVGSFFPKPKMIINWPVTFRTVKVISFADLTQVLIDPGHRLRRVETTADTAGSLQVWLWWKDDPRLELSLEQCFMVV